MFKNLFAKRDRRVIAGITKEQAMQASSWFWRSRQFGVSFATPYALRGEQYYSKLGLRQSVDVSATDEQEGVAIDLQFSAGLTDEGAVLGAVGAVLVLPVAAVVGAVSYVEYENDAMRQMNEFWMYVNGFLKDQKPPQAPAAPPTWAKGQPPQPESPQAAAAQKRVCPGCAAPLDPDSMFCKFCGSKV